VIDSHKFVAFRSLANIVCLLKTAQAGLDEDLNEMDDV
jgi:hypothetical protein